MFTLAILRKNVKIVNAVMKGVSSFTEEKITDASEKIRLTDLMK